MITLQLPQMCNYKQQINNITLKLPEILALIQVRHARVNPTNITCFIYYTLKMIIIPHIVFEKLKFKKSCSLIAGEHFGLSLENQLFPRHAVFTITPNILLLVQICLIYPIQIIGIYPIQVFCFWYKFVSFTQLSR